MLLLPRMTTVGDGAFLADDTMIASYELRRRLDADRAGPGRQAGVPRQLRHGRPGRTVPKDGLVAVLSATPAKARRARPGWAARRCSCGARRRGRSARTFAPPLRLRVARALVELCRLIPTIFTFAIGIGVLLTLDVAGRRLGWVAAGLLERDRAAGGRGGRGGVATRPSGFWSAGSARSSIRCGARSCGATRSPTRSSRWSPRRGSPGGHRDVGAQCVAALRSVRGSGAGCGARPTGCPRPTSSASATARPSTAAASCRPTCSMIES